MPDEKDPNLTPAELQKLLAGTNDERSLILNAYMDEEKRWADKLQLLYEKRNGALLYIQQLKDKLHDAYNKLKIEEEDAKQEHGAVKALLNFIGAKTKKQKAADASWELVEEFRNTLVEATKVYQEIEQQYIETSNNPPDLFRYELAMLNNQLFKPQV